MRSASSRVYSLLREHVAELNVEGAATMGERLWLLQRGNSEQAGTWWPSSHSTT